MPKYLMRSWQTQTLKASEDYEVEAESEGEAARLLQDAQEEAQDDGHVARVVGVRRVTCHGRNGPAMTAEGVRQLDPTDVDDAENGIILLDAEGSEVRPVLPTREDPPGAQEA